VAGLFSGGRSLSRCCTEHIADVTCRRQMLTDLRYIMAVCRFTTKIPFCYYRRKEKWKQ
jgi:hypothetical protein